MPRLSILFVQAALAVVPLLPSGALSASAPDAVPAPNSPHLVPSPVPEWSGHPPEPVRAAAAALHDACAAWPKQSRLASDPRPFRRSTGTRRSTPRPASSPSTRTNPRLGP